MYRRRNYFNSLKHNPLLLLKFCQGAWSIHACGWKLYSVYFTQEFSAYKAGIHQSYYIMVNMQYLTRLLIIFIGILIGNQNARESAWPEKDAW